MKKCACKDGRRCPRHLLGDVVFALEKEIEANKTNLGKDLRNFRSSSKPEDVLTALAHVHATVVRASKMVVNRYAIQELSLLTRLAAWLFFVRGGSWRVQFGVPRYGLDWSKACFARPETYRSGS